MIILTAEQYGEILEHARRAAPDEACGLLGGTAAGDTRTVRRVYLLTNVDHCPEHFSMDPREQFAAVGDMRQNGWELLGNFHSHPAAPSRPSAEDRRLAFDAGASYLILSLMDEQQPVLKSFRIEGELVREEKIMISGGESNGRG
jgi:proteasome lid subunit RPN8/RPN11